jgi:hypothetical protein
MTEMDAVSAEENRLTLSLYFAHTRHLATALSELSASAFLAELESAHQLSQPFSGIRKSLACRAAIEELLMDPSIRPISRALLDPNIGPGHLTTMAQDIYFRGMGAALASPEDSRVTFHNTIRALPDWRISGSFSPRHLLNSTARTRLSGHARMTLVGFLRDVDPGKRRAEVEPLVFGDPIMRSGVETGSWDPLRLEVHPEEIDEFVLADRPDDFSIRWMKSIPESEVKSAIASIASEPFVPKDWGGETSDLYTTRLHLRGEPVRTAFLLKGPAAYHKMTIADLGENGDQIDRLFSEPADLFVIQHCHEITPAVHRMMEAYSFQRSFQKGLTRFCLLDGPDTYRLLLSSGFVGSDS